MHNFYLYPLTSFNADLQSKLDQFYNIVQQQSSIMNFLKDKYCTVHPQTKKSKLYANILKVIAFLHLALLILDAIFIKELVAIFVLGFLILILIIHAINRYSYHSMTIILTFSCFSFFLYLVQIMTIFQHQQKISEFDGRQRLYFYVLWLGIGKSLFLMIFSYFPYKEFKIGFFMKLDRLQEEFNKNNNINDSNASSKIINQQNPALNMNGPQSDRCEKKQVPKNPFTIVKIYLNIN